MDVEDLILYFYARPMQMRVKKLDNYYTIETILICPHSDWTFVKEHLLQNDDQRFGLYRVIQNQWNDWRVRRWEWASLRWNEEDDIFKVYENRRGP